MKRQQRDRVPQHVSVSRLVKVILYSQLEQNTQQPHCSSIGISVSRVRGAKKK